MNICASCLERLRMPWLYWVVLAVSALLTPFAFAPYRLFWLMPLLLALLLLLTQIRPQYMVRSAYLWGLLAYTAQFYWIDIALHNVAGLTQFFALPLTLLLPAYLALYPAMVFWLLEKFCLSQWLRLIAVFPMLWTLAEFARERALTGFGWGATGYSQIAESPLAGFVPISGIHLVTLATVLLAALLAAVILSKKWIQRTVFLSAALVLLLLGEGLKHISFTEPDGSKNSVALLQGNIEQTLKWRPEIFAETVQQYYNQVVQSHADIVILPETAIPEMRQNLPQGLLASFATQAKRNGSDLAAGMAQYTADGQGYLNAVVNLSAFDPDAEDNLPFYAKNHLVPFGEYIPLPAVTEWLYRQMNIPLAGFSRGGAAQAPLLLGKQKVAFNICYEDSFGDELIASAKQASLLANVSNMAWYGKSAAMDQHLQQSQARALEMGRFMVRATNTGMTAVINPQGQVLALLPPDTQQTLTAEIVGYRGQTPYMRLGGSIWLIGLLACFLAALSVYGRYRRRALADENLN
ncbi:apolipoprotein N-acyltransferase [Stenoxybacter acetivorans]|uniref:apolipoprotein N-acyltransferase n=1 Tax=Stenoxybacter acetivorans TaxID=422441 RepID=UPI000559C1A3|nr:apolipoprotein N-acyltransferase [Stenoxybacter acetivorans]